MENDCEKRILEFLEKGILLSPDVADELDTLGAPDASDALLIDHQNKGFLGETVDWERLDDAKVKAEKHNDPGQYDKFVELANEKELSRESRGIRILRNYMKKSRKYTYDDFVSHFNQRFKALSAILRQRQELQGATAIIRAKRAAPKERLALIGMVKEKNTTKNGNILLVIEDQTGEINVLAGAKRPETLALAKDVVLDEVLGVTGSAGDGIVFADELYFPDIPVSHELKKGPDDDYVAVIGDPQVGGKEFLGKDFAKMLAWLNGKLGSEEQRAIAAKVKYVIVIGDLVEGVGVYPGQEKDLRIKDIKEQYAEFARLMRQIPSRMEIVCIPGNHDAGRISEPQPPIYKDFAPELYAMENVTMLSSPSLLTLGARPGFPGFDVLLYHGYSLIYYSDNVPSIRERGGQKRAELIMKFLLQRRHLAPTHASNLYVPDPEQDPLVIDRIPDLFITGHVHRVASAAYRGVTILNASAWCDITDDQEKRGLEPQPGRMPVISLRTRDIKVINFYSGKGLGKDDPVETPSGKIAGGGAA